MPVYWSIRARRHLRQALAEALGREHRDGPAAADGGTQATCPGAFEQTRDDLDAMLALAFRGATVFVTDHAIGYRRKEDRYTLLVEVFDEATRDPQGSHVVKIGPEDKSREEIRGWECCKPQGAEHDLVLLWLRKLAEMPFGGRPMMCLAYGDAQLALGVADTRPLEEAMLECVRDGVPRAASIGVVLGELYDRIGHLLYGQAFVADPAREGFVLDVPKLDDGLWHWENDDACRAARKDAGHHPIGSPYLDPVTYLRYIQRHVRHVGRDGRTVEPSAGEGSPIAGPTSVQAVPRMLRGCGHGDLHGRNVLVGIVRDQAMWPMVFDYEDMGPRNLIGWDFVKLETEFKIRAYPDVFSGKAPIPFAQAIREFEADLDARTEDCHLTRSWPEIDEPTGAADRLRGILMAIRKLGAQHLGISHGRPGDWLEEYYFLLACYGVATGRFANVQHRERIGAIISAGVAASRLSWARALDLGEQVAALLRLRTSDASGS